MMESKESEWSKDDAERLSLENQELRRELLQARALIQAREEKIRELELLIRKRQTLAQRAPDPACVGGI